MNVLFNCMCIEDLQLCVCLALAVLTKKNVFREVDDDDDHETSSHWLSPPFHNTVMTVC